MKKICIISVLFLIILFNGCSTNFEENSDALDFTKEEFQVMAEEYLLNKYGKIDYYDVYVTSPNFDNRYYYMEAKTKSYDGEEVWLYVNMYVKEYDDSSEETTWEWLEEPILEDNYMGYVVQEEYQDLVSGYLDKYFEEFKISLGFNLVYTREIDYKEITLDEFFNEREKHLTGRPNIWILVCDEYIDLNAFNTNTKEFLDEWEDTNIESKIAIYYINKENYDFSLYKENIKSFREMY